MAELFNCTKCNKIFNKIGKETYCFDCRKEEELLLKEISRFIRRKKERIESMDIILENFDVTREQLLKWVKEKRLHESNLQLSTYHCKMCNIELKHEGLCEDCSKELSTELKLFNTRTEIDNSKLNSSYYSKDK